MINGSVYVADSNNNRVRLVTHADDTPRTIVAGVTYVYGVSVANDKETLILVIPNLRCVKKHHLPSDSTTDFVGGCGAAAANTPGT